MHSVTFSLLLPIKIPKSGYEFHKKSEKQGGFFFEKSLCIWMSLIVYNACKVKRSKLYPRYIFEQAFYRLILLIQKNEKINILISDSELF